MSSSKKKIKAYDLEMDSFQGCLKPFTYELGSHQV